MTSEQKRDSPMTPQEFYAIHQRSFRTAFDFLNAHFPPENDPQWWKKLCEDIQEASAKDASYKLTVCLLQGVFDYLDYEQERRKTDEA